MRGRRFEVSTYGFDPNIQVIGSDPYGGAGTLGLLIPATLPTDPSQRYLFMLAQAQFGAHESGRIVGLRQYVSLGVNVPSTARSIIDGRDVGPLCEYPLELEVKAPAWHPVDANISWHLTRVEPDLYQTSNPSNAEGFQFLSADTPALVYATPLPDYHGPNGGRPYGTALDPQLGCFYDLRYPWQNDDEQYLDIEFEGPCKIVLWASVRQTVPGTRCPLNLTGTVTTLMIPPEDAFLVNFPLAVYARVAGSIIFETDNMVELARDLVAPRAAIDDCGCPDPRTAR